MRQPLARVDEIPAEGLLFTYRDGPFDTGGILLRLPDGTPRAYKNECRHLALRLDEREPHTLWEADGRHLHCTAHGALFRPSDGLCTAGPCKGSHLRELPLIVENDTAWLDTSQLGSFFA